MQNSQVTPKDLVQIDVSLLLSKLPNLLVGLIIFFSATQLGFHFWPISSLVYGIRIDYLSPTLYFLDLLIILFLVLSRQFRSFGGLQHSERQIGTLRLTVPLLLTNLLYSQNPLATLSWSLHFILYLSFFATLLPEFRSFGGLQQSARQIGTSVISSTLTFTLLFQTILASIQVYLGHSVGGLLYYLGERNVVVGSPNIALGSFTDSVVLRAYGTFSHPNILAGYAVISFLIILSLVLKRSDLVGCKPNQKPTRSDLVGVIFPLLLTTLLILLTQSRSAAISLFGIIIPFYLIKKIRFRLIYFVLVFTVICQFSTVNFFSPTRSDLSSSQRLTLQGVSLSVIRSYPLFGTGAQASISTYPQVDPSIRLLQPDHDSFTLFFSWFGLFGVLAILFALPQQFRSLRDSRRVIGTFVIPLLPLLVFDHYLLTSPQGLFILLLLIFAKLVTN